MLFPFALSVYGAFYSSLWWISVVACMLLWLALVSFFRNPWRIIPTDLPDGAMLSPADGVVSAIEFLDEHETVEGPAVLIRIFLSVLNVHINRMPCDCELDKMVYRKGKFLDARSEESAKINESNALFLFTNGERIGMRQVSGKIARNIVCPIKAGDRFRQGQQFGMIKFGSTAELILPRPDQVHIIVAKGESVRGGLTQLATLASKSS
jgi:phosphatidylserine decarboxylase